jgi:hypothetical protein
MFIVGTLNDRCHAAAFSKITSLSPSYTSHANKVQCAACSHGTCRCVWGCCKVVVYIIRHPDIKPRTVGESQAKANWIRNSVEEVGVAGPHTLLTTRWHSKSSPRMEPPSEPDPKADPQQHGAEQSSNRLDIKAKHGKKSKYSPKTVSDVETLWGPYVPLRNDGKLYIYIYIIRHRGPWCYSG